MPTETPIATDKLDTVPTAERLDDHIPPAGEGVRFDVAPEQTLKTPEIETAVETNTD